MLNRCLRFCLYRAETSGGGVFNAGDKDEYRGEVVDDDAGKECDYTVTACDQNTLNQTPSTVKWVNTLNQTPSTVKWITLCFLVFFILFLWIYLSNGEVTKK